MTNPTTTSQGEPAIAELQAALDRLSANHGPRKVLEAGCGSMSHVRVENAYLVGIDVSEQQLERNAKLREAIRGDIQTYALAADEYDVIVCWDVLEHLPEPRLALRNFVRAVKPGGLIVLAVPNLFSIKGLLTKLTPHAFHVWAYRRFWGVELAGHADRAPFRTFLKLDAAPSAVRRLARTHGLAVEYFSSYESIMQRRFRENHPLLSPAFTLADAAGRFLTLGRLRLSHTDYAMILRKPAGAPPR